MSSASGRVAFNIKLWMLAILLALAGGTPLRAQYWYVDGGGVEGYFTGAFAGPPPTVTCLGRRQG
jgi:hypothetical protein